MKRPQVVLASTVLLLAFTWVVTHSNSVTAQSPHPGSAPVTVVSPIPLPVTGFVNDVGRGAPFTTTVPKNSPMGEPPAVTFPTVVSPGQLVVIEQVSVKLSNCPTGTLTVEDFSLRAGTKAVFLAPVHVLSTFANAFIANEHLKFVVEPGEMIVVETENFGTSGCGPASLIATISGAVIRQP